MGIRNTFTIVTASAVTIAALSLPAFARAGAAATTEFSAQSQDPKKNPKAKPAPARPAQTIQRPPHRPAPVVRTAPVHRAAPVVRPVQRPMNTQRNIVVPRVVTPNRPMTAAPRIIAAPRQGNRAFTPRGASSNVVRAARIRSAPPRGIGRTTIQGRNYSVWRSNYRVRRGNGWRTFVALGALGTIAIGASQYYPYAYIQAPAPYCDGRTEDGCQLVFEDVETVEGDVIGQCVAYCPWQ
jgi:hypothetical protein